MHADHQVSRKGLTVRSIRTVKERRDDAFSACTDKPRAKSKGNVGTEMGLSGRGKHLDVGNDNEVGNDRSRSRWWHTALTIQGKGSLVGGVARHWPVGTRDPGQENS